MTDFSDQAGGGPGPPSAGGGGAGGPGTEEERLQELRQRIQAVDEALVELIRERRALVLEIGELKARLDLPVLDPAREAAVVRRAAALAREKGVDEELTRDVIWRIMASAREDQKGPP